MLIIFTIVKRKKKKKALMNVVNIEYFGIHNRNKVLFQSGP